eukprot:6800318-Pyramimonas_sp.AAC.1
MCGGIPFQDLQGLSRQCSGTNGVCSRTGRKHVILSGPAPSGAPWTQVAQPCPQQLNRALARALVAPIRVKLFQA